ncbi:hypothetical protein U1T56_02180 [Geminicoccaceae bacterium SYSU G07066]|uniref:Uncharacterized protein n=1 Tax=Benzoatithermus flavus TaxID=3108223 RepID=A0ABU8XNH7_9PROT
MLGQKDADLPGEAQHVGADRAVERARQKAVLDALPGERQRLLQREQEGRGPVGGGEMRRPQQSLAEADRAHTEPDRARGRFVRGEGQGVPDHAVQDAEKRRDGSTVRLARVPRAAGRPSQHDAELVRRALQPHRRPRRLQQSRIVRIGACHGREPDLCRHRPPAALVPVAFGAGVGAGQNAIEMRRQAGAIAGSMPQPERALPDRFQLRWRERQGRGELPAAPGECERLDRLHPDASRPQGPAQGDERSGGIGREVRRIALGQEMMSPSVGARPGLPLARVAVAQDREHVREAVGQDLAPVLDGGVELLEPGLAIRDRAVGEMGELVIVDPFRGDTARRQHRPVRIRRLGGAGIEGKDDLGCRMEAILAARRGGKAGSQRRGERFRKEQTWIAAPPEPRTEGRTRVVDGDGEIGRSGRDAVGQRACRSEHGIDREAFERRPVRADVGSRDRGEAIEVRCSRWRKDARTLRGACRGFGPGTLVERPAGKEVAHAFVPAVAWALGRARLGIKGPAAASGAGEAPRGDLLLAPAPMLPGRHERAGPHAAPLRARRLLLAEIVLAVPAVGECPAVLDHPGIDLGLAHPADGHRPVPAIPLPRAAFHGPRPDQVGEGEGRLPAARPGLAVQLAGLSRLRRIDRLQPDAVAVDLQRVAVDHRSATGDHLLLPRFLPARGAGGFVGRWRAAGNQPEREEPKHDQGVSDDLVHAEQIIAAAPIEKSTP